MTALLLALALAGGGQEGAPRVNELTASQLDAALPGVGVEACRAVVAWREAHGALEGPRDLALIEGLGRASRRLLASRADFSPAEQRVWPEELASGPVDLNTADPGELAALPGIGSAKAADIVRFREERGPFASCAELARLPGTGPATVAGLGELCTVAPAR